MNGDTLLEEERVLLHVIAKELDRIGPPLEPSERSSVIEKLREIQQQSAANPPKTGPDRFARLVGIGLLVANVSCKPFTSRGVINDVRPEAMRKIKRLVQDLPYIKAALSQCTETDPDAPDTYYCESCFRGYLGEEETADCQCGRLVCKNCLRGGWCEACMYQCESCGLTRSEPLNEKPRICSCGKRMCPECDIDGTCEVCTAT